MKRTTVQLALGLTAALTIAIGAACTSPTNNPPTLTVEDGGIKVVFADSGQITIPFDAAQLSCTVGAQECLSSTVARVCPADGQWAAFACGQGQICQGGSCITNPSPACTSAQNTCTSSTTAMRCASSGAGFTTVTCPTGTTCQGAGQCTGAYPVGPVGCSEDGTSLYSSTDGFTETPTACPSGQLCVNLSEIGGPIACLPAACNPNTFCPACGNPNDSTADQTKYTTQCSATVSGFKVTAVECSTGSCNPNSDSCGNGQPYASCQSQCSPGGTRCAADNSIQTCDNTGNWGAPVACNADTTTSLICGNSPTTNVATCGDAICLQNGERPQYYGSCDTGGKIFLCNNGHLSTTSTTCPGNNSNDTCISQPQDVTNGVAYGYCGNTTCESGDSQCYNNNSYQTCDNGNWSVPVSCGADPYDASSTGTDQCYGYTTSAGRPTHICNAQCVPGSTTCAPFGDGGSGTVTCDSTGHYGTTVTACNTGSCQDGSDSNNNPLALCLSECVPGTTVCGDGGTQLCDSTGHLEPVVPCNDGGSGDLNCYPDTNGYALGCFECLGTGHPGLTPETRCVDAQGQPGGNAVAETCTAQNTWPTVSNSLTCSSGTSCTTESTQYYCYGPSGSGSYCETYWGYGGSVPIQCGSTANCCTYPDNGGYNYWCQGQSIYGQPATCSSSNQVPQ